MAKTIASWDHTKLTTQQEVIIDHYKKLASETENWITYLQASNKIGLDDSIENIKERVKTLGLEGEVLDNVISKLALLKEAQSDTFTNIIEKWGIDNRKATLDVIDGWENLNLTFGQVEETALRAIVARQQAIVKEQKVLKEATVLEAKTATDKKAVWDKYYASLAPLLEESKTLDQKLNNDKTYQLAVSLQEQKVILEKALKVAAQTYEGNFELIAKKQAAARKKYRDAEEKLLQGIQVDPEKKNESYKATLDSRKTILPVTFVRLLLKNQ